MRTSGFESLDGSSGGLQIGGLAHDLEVVLSVEKRLQGPAHDRVIVGQDNGDPLGGTVPPAGAHLSAPA